MTKSKTLFWNAYARIYDGLLETIPYQRLLKKTLDRVPAGAARLLDAGCGTGNLLNAARVRHPALALHGIDFSRVMLSLAQEKVTGAKLTVGDLNAPPVPLIGPCEHEDASCAGAERAKHLPGECPRLRRGAIAPAVQADLAD